MFYSKSKNGFYDPAVHTSYFKSHTVTKGEGEDATTETVYEPIEPIADAVELSEEHHNALIDGQSLGKIIVADASGFPVLQDPPPPTPEQVKAQFEAAIQQRLDEFARTRGYSGILSACTYATSTVPRFAAEGQHCVNLRDVTWSAAYQLLDEVLSGVRPVPQSIADIEQDLPVLAWPAE
jgi:hypothetical protein